MNTGCAECLQQNSGEISPSIVLFALDTFLWGKVGGELASQVSQASVHVFSSVRLVALHEGIGVSTSSYCRAADPLDVRRLTCLLISLTFASRFCLCPSSPCSFNFFFFWVFVRFVSRFFFFQYRILCQTKSIIQVRCRTSRRVTWIISRKAN